MAGQNFLFVCVFIFVSATLLHALFFCALFSFRGFRTSASNLFIAAFMVFMAATKGDQLFQMAGGFTNHPHFAFVLAPFQTLLTPALFFFLRARVSPQFQLRAIDAIHLIPITLYTTYLALNVYSADAEARDAFLTAGLSAIVPRLIIPVIGDILQLSYIVAALILLHRHGMVLRNWYSRIEGKDLAWLRYLMLGWAVIFILHLVLTLGSYSAGLSSFLPPIVLILNGVHYLFVVLLSVLAIVDAVERRSEAGQAIPRYASSTLDSDARADLHLAAVDLVGREQLFLETDLTLADLANRLAATPRELSEAINGHGGGNFFEFVNRHRIAFAQSRLAEDPPRRIIDIAFESGFGSKSAFNNAFRRCVGLSPSAYRQIALNSKREPT
jgi:AraC-like DNA-binding protein